MININIVVVSKSWHYAHD